MLTHGSYGPTVHGEVPRSNDGTRYELPLPICARLGDLADPLHDGARLLRPERERACEFEFEASRAHTWRERQSQPPMREEFRVGDSNGREVIAHDLQRRRVGERYARQVVRWRSNHSDGGRPHRDRGDFERRFEKPLSGQRRLPYEAYFGLAAAVQLVRNAHTQVVTIVFDRATFLSLGTGSLDRESGVSIRYDIRCTKSLDMRDVTTWQSHCTSRFLLQSEGYDATAPNTRLDLCDRLEPALREARIPLRIAYVPTAWSRRELSQHDAARGVVEIDADGIRRTRAAACRRAS